MSTSNLLTDRLHAEDLADLRRSGLSDVMIEAMGCSSAEANKIHELTEVKVNSPGYSIPYEGIVDQTGNPYIRWRLRNPTEKMKYVSGRGDDPQIYLPPGLDNLPDHDLLVITEGEKKAAKAVQEGIPCIGIQGVWSWADAGSRAVEKANQDSVSEETEPIREILETAQMYKKVLVLGDSDLLDNPQARAGMTSLAKALAHRNVRCVAAYCPPATVAKDGKKTIKKQGLDDWLVTEVSMAKRSLGPLFFAAEVSKDKITDSFNARVIADLFRNNLAYSRGVWYCWDGVIWGVDDDGNRRKLPGKVAAFYRAQAEQLRRLAARVTGLWDSKDSYPEILNQWLISVHAAIEEAPKAATAIEELRHMDAAFTIAQAHLGLPSDVWDSYADLLAVHNGVVDLHTGELRPPDPGLYLTRMAGAAYDPSATAPGFHKFLEEVQPDAAVRDYLQRLAGYCALADASEQKFFCFVGEGANGKGTFIGVLMKALGKYARKAPASMLAQQSGEKPRNDVADLAGARLVSVSETSANLRIDEALIKTLTGEDVITARHLFKELFQFRPCFTPILDTNHAPRPRESGVAIWRRMVVVPWSVTITDDRIDKQLGKRLVSELPGILNWIIEGARHYLRTGLPEIAQVRTASTLLRQSCDVVGRWFHECTIDDPAARSQGSLLYDSFREWWLAEGESGCPLSNRVFAEKLEAKGYSSHKTGGRSIWFGVRLRAAAPPQAGSTTPTASATWPRSSPTRQELAPSPNSVPTVTSPKGMPA